MMTGLEKINHTDQKTVKNRIKAIFYTVLYTLLIPSMLLFQGIRASLKNGVKALFSYLNITFNVADMSGHAITIIRLSEIVTLAMMILVIVLTFTYLPSGDRKIRSQLYIDPLDPLHKGIRLFYPEILEIFLRLLSPRGCLSRRNVDEIYHQHPFLRSIPQQGPAGKGFEGLSDITNMTIYIIKD